MKGRSIRFCAEMRIGMKFVKTEEMEIGRLIGKPVYNSKGVLLYNSGVKISPQMLSNFREMELYGTYVLDNGEPVPPITDEEQEFERFQSMHTYDVNDILTAVVQGKGTKGREELVDVIMRRFGSMPKKIVFNQCVRSEKDFISKHTLNVAILSVMIADKMKFDSKEKKYLIEAALFHEVGKLLVPPNILHKKEKLTEQEMQVVNKCLLQGFEMLGRNYQYPAGVRRYIIQLSKELADKLVGGAGTEQAVLPGTKILKVADIYDILTAIRPYKEPVSALSAMQTIRREPENYDSLTVDALEACLNILPVGSYVRLSNHEQAIVIRENPKSLLRPVVLGLKTNKLYDLANRAVREEIQIIDTVFTTDNRLKIQADRVKEFMAKRQ